VISPYCGGPHPPVYRDSVRGLVLVDPMNPRFVQATGEFVHSTVPHIEHPASSKDSALVRLVNTFDGLVRDPEASDVGLGVPMVIVTAGEEWWGRKDIDRAWRGSHEAMAQAAPDRRLVVADGSNHDIPAKRPHTIIDAVLSLANRP
jgi:pimeloyl-ACP methyl ester carboxylesterase